MVTDGKKMVILPKCAIPLLFIRLSVTVPNVIRDFVVAPLVRQKKETKIRYFFLFLEIGEKSIERDTPRRL